MTKDQALELLKSYKPVKISQIDKAEWNYKIDDEKKKEKLKKQIVRNNQIENIIVRIKEDSRYECINGNHRLDAFKEMNWEYCIAYDCGKISQATAERIAIETNETKFNSDNLKIAELITDILKEYDMKEIELTMPYTMEELKDYSELLDSNWAQFNKDKKDNSDSKGEKVEEKWIDIIIRAPQLESDIFYSEMDRLKDIAKTDSDWVALKYMAINSSQTPTESLE